MSDNPIPKIVISRLPVYLRALSRMVSKGQLVTSSHELGKALGISSAQIRKDLSHFGEFGKQGTGYQVEFLISQLSQILNLDREWEVAVIGSGDIGHAIARYQGFSDRGFRVSVIFDSDPHKVGSFINGLEVLPSDKIIEVLTQRNIQIAMLAIPAEYAQKVTDTVVEAGVRAILSYAPISLNVPDHVRVSYIDPVTHLQSMTYYLSTEADLMSQPL